MYFIARGMHVRSLLHPVWMTFFVSIVLSVIAVLSNTLNRDGMLYVEAARAFMQDGMSAATAVFSWPFLPILMGWCSLLTGLDPEFCGHLLNILFMAGACALLVAVTARAFPELGWFTALVVLAIPGLNEYRHELIREYGCWFFTMLSFWAAQHWAENPRWRTCLVIHLSLLLAALFRPEALVFYPCLLAWQFFHAKREGRWKRLLMLGGIPVVLFCLLLSSYLSGMLPETSRLAAELARFDFLSRFDSTARNMGMAFNFYAREEAETAHVILFFGSLAIIPFKFLLKTGVFLLPLGYAFFLPDRRRETLARLSIFSWAFAGHALMLAVFVLQQQFLSGRYIALLLLFSAPLAALGLRQAVLCYPRIKSVLVAICLAIMFANVVSLKPDKAHFVDAGKWMAANIENGNRVYIESARAAHYAGFGFSAFNAARLSREMLAERIAAGQYDVLVLEVSRKESDIGSWIANAGLQEMRRFLHPNGDAIIVLRTKNANISASTTAEQ